MTSTTTLIELNNQGNSLFSQKQFINAIDKYTQVIEAMIIDDDNNDDTMNAQILRALANRSQCYLYENQYQLTIDDCNQVLSKYDNKHEKSYYRRSVALHKLQHFYLSYRDVLIGLYYHPQSQPLIQWRLQLERTLKFCDLNELMKSMTKICDYYLKSTRQLKAIEHQKYHDVWELEDYFDRENEIRKFDVPCPPHLFVSTPTILNDQIQYYSQFNQQQEQQQREQLQQEEEISQFYTMDDSRSFHQFHLSLYYKYSQGIYRSSGFPNVYFSYALLVALLQQDKQFFLLVPNHQSTSTSSDPFTLMRVKSVGIRCGNIRCKSITWFTIGKGHVVVRDYDPHVWTCLQLESVKEAERNDVIEIDIDFVAAQFNYFNYHRETNLPLRIFSQEMNKREELLNNDEWRSHYKSKRVFWDDQALQYIQQQYHQDYPIESTHTDKGIETIAQYIHQSVIKLITI